MSDEASDDAIQLPAVWVGSDDVPVRTVNQLIGQVSAPEEIVLTFGHFVPPVLLGTPDERREQAAQLSFVPVQTIARFGLTARRLEEFKAVIQETLDNYAKMNAGEQS